MNNAALNNEQDIYVQLDKCYARISTYQTKIRELESYLLGSEKELDAISDDRQKYELLSGICQNLGKLNEIGGASLFWSDLLNVDQVESQLNRLRDQVAFFERRIKKVTDKRDDLLKEIDNNRVEIGYLEDEIDYLKEQEEQSKYEYVVDRVISNEPARIIVLPWTRRREDDRQFRKILSLVLIISLLLGILIPLYNIPIPDRTEVVKVPERLATLVKKRLPKPKPKPQPEQKKSEEKKKPEEKKVAKEEHQKAREHVKSKGVLAFKNNFADLLDDAALNKLGKNVNLSNAGSTAKRTKRSILTSQATSTSGGISSSSLSHNVAGTGQNLSAVAFSRVQSDIGTAEADDRPLSSGVGPSRTDEEIQIVFDRYKAALYRIYNRELRINPTLQGKVMLRITIEPDGAVSLCKVESAELDSKVLLAKIVARVKRFNFGKKAGVPPVTILYPIDFLPAS